MAKIAVLDDYPTYAEMVAAPLRLAGHEVYTGVMPVDWDAVVAFEPVVITFELFRRREAENRPIRAASADIIGYQSLLEAERYPAIKRLPILIVASGFEDRDLPTTINYDRFLQMPEESEKYVAEVEELVGHVTQRRRLSGHVCPICGSRMVGVGRLERDLFCPRCHTAVALDTANGCLMMVRGMGPTIPCDLEKLKPPPVRKRTESGK